MASRRPSGTRRSVTGTRRQPKRSLNVQTLEKRQLLAAEVLAGPQAVGIAIGEDTSFTLDTTPGEAVPARNILTEAPKELVFRFAGGNPLSDVELGSIQVVASGGDGTFGDGNEINVIPGFRGFASDDVNQRVVVTRFSETLNDDVYRILLPGQPALPADIAVGSPSVDFELQLGTRVVAVVPQPIDINAPLAVGRLSQIDVYFRGDALDPAVAENPEFYRLIEAGDSIQLRSGETRASYQPASVAYDAATNRARLTFAADLDVLSGTSTTQTYRLRVGSAGGVANNPIVVDANETDVQGRTTDDTPDLFSAATVLPGVGTDTFTVDGGTQSVVVQDASIENGIGYQLPWPGAYDTQGLREQRRDANILAPIDTQTGINVLPYNFANIIGRTPAGDLAENAITPAQRQRAREILDLYEEELGVRFIETQDSGVTIATGQIRSILSTADTAGNAGDPYSLFRVNEQDPTRGILVLNGNVPWYNGYGLTPRAENPSWFVEAIRGVGSLLGIGDLYELPGGIAGVSSPDEPNSEIFSDDGSRLLGDLPASIAGFPTVRPEPDFLSDAAITIGKALYRPESSDVDFYRFNVAGGNGETVAGKLDIELFAQRLDDVSLLDTDVKLFRVNTVDGIESFELIGRNDDYFSDDSFLSIELAAGQYVVGVASSGNESYDGNVADTGSGGRSEGRYEMRLTFTGDAAAVSTPQLRDIDGTPIDGDSDGEVGGNFDFWFSVTPDVRSTTAPQTFYVTKDPARGNDATVNDGSLQFPLLTIDEAIRRVNARANPANAATTPILGDIIRLLPNGGDDEVVATDADNLPYQIGRGGPADTPLDDGESFEVPRGATVMIDAGAILKFRDSRIAVGSQNANVDRSAASLQILGTPIDTVTLTSFEDDANGVATDNLPRLPRNGDWAGIEFRNDVDIAQGRRVLENDGIFLDYVSNATILYGGGQVTVNEPQVAPIELNQARPTLIDNTIRFSRQAAIAADPDSFREDTFHAPRFQRGVLTTVDYDRVGPVIVGNTVTDNAVNGIQIRVDTPNAAALEALTVSARFDDTEIVHVLSEVLVIQGNVGGPILLEDRPDVASVAVQTRTGGQVPAGSYDYVVTFVTSEGAESLASDPTRQVTLAAAGAIQLSNLPVVEDDLADRAVTDASAGTGNAFTGRNLYRRVDDGGSISYQLVAQLDRNTRSFIDRAATAGPQTVVAETTPVAGGVTPIPFNGSGTLVRNRTYDYRITFVDAAGGETRSAVTQSVVAGQDGSFFLTNLPTVPEEFVGQNLYRVDPLTGEYLLIAELRLGETQFFDSGEIQQLTVDAGTLLGRQLGNDIAGGTALLPRLDSRLTIDPQCYPQITWLADRSWLWWRALRRGSRR